MHLADLPRNHRNQIHWSKLFATAIPGDTLDITCGLPRVAKRIRGNVTKTLRGFGIPHSTAIAGATVHVAVIAPRGPYKSTPPGPDLSHAARLLEIAEARENLRYWQRQQVIREHPQAKAHAGACVLAWQSTLAAREGHLNQLATA